MSQANPKTPKRKGIAAAKKARKREEAEERNARTLPENRRAFRREQEGNYK